MAGAKSNPPKPRKRVEAETLKRARDGSAFTRCEACNKDVPVVLIDMHSCSLDSKIRLSLEAQVVEKVVEAKKAEKKRSSPSTEKKEGKKEGSAKKAKKSDDSGKRKRPPTAFFVFMKDFREEFKEANPDNKSVSLVAKEGGEKWKSMTDEEKKPYIEKAAQLKAEYEKAVEEDKNAENGEQNEEDANEEENGEQNEEDAHEEENGEQNEEDAHEEENGEQNEEQTEENEKVTSDNGNVADKENGNED